MSFQSWIKLTTDEFHRVFSPVFRTPREAIQYAEHKVDIWPTCESFGIQEVELQVTCEWRNGKLQPVNLRRY